MKTIIPAVIFLCAASVGGFAGDAKVRQTFPLGSASLVIKEVTNVDVAHLGKDAPPLAELLDIRTSNNTPKPPAIPGTYTTVQVNSFFEFVVVRNGVESPLLLLLDPPDPPSGDRLPLKIIDALLQGDKLSFIYRNNSMELDAVYAAAGADGKFHVVKQTRLGAGDGRLHLSSKTGAVEIEGEFDQQPLLIGTHSETEHKVAKYFELNAAGEFIKKDAPEN